MCFGPGHVSKPYASMAQWLACRTLNQLARVRFPMNANRTFLSYFFLLEIKFFFVLFISKSNDISNKSEKLPSSIPYRDEQSTK